MVSLLFPRGLHGSGPLRTLLLAGVALVPQVAFPSAAHANCEDLLPASSVRGAVQDTTSRAGVPARKGLRPVTSDDLVRLRDLGPADGSETAKPSPLAVSPTGKEVAFVLSRADPAGNRYCRALVVVALAGGAPPRIVGSGGDYMFDAFPMYGRMLRNGFTAVVTPQWSPDGRSIAYLRRDDDREAGKVQVWLARSDGGGARPVTHSPVDVEAAVWSEDGARLVYASRPAAAEVERAVAREGLAGWLYDERSVPTGGPVPQAPVQPIETMSIAPDGSDPRRADAGEMARLEAVDASDHASKAIRSDGSVASAALVDGHVYAPRRITVASAGSYSSLQPSVNCEDPVCTGTFNGVWWGTGGREVLFLRREGWNKEITALYRWSGKTGQSPVSILKTRDVLLGCVPAAADLLCTRENATTPRHIARVDTGNGRITGIYDPNPEFRGLALGKVERIRWRNDLGLETWGDLVLPPGYRQGKPLPMVVVQYRSRGFLRGGTGDEYPIHALAAKGIAVLSIERPASVATLHPEIRTGEEFLKVMTRDWAERRSMQSAIETGVRMVVDRGIADPARLGITGLSDGASSARWALLNSDLFKVAAISTCCVDENALIYNGLAVEKQFEEMGYPPPGSEDRAFWQPYSLARNARRVDRPLLMQLADDEYLGALNTFAVLRSAKRPVEMFVFPDEHHNKWQPVHRAAVYARNLDWFAFWLQDRRDPVPSKKAQYARWEAMRDHPRASP